jgi:hypothetical protein
MIDGLSAPKSAATPMWQKLKKCGSSDDPASISREIPLWQKMRKCLRREDGGAIVEFVALAIPLFIPIFLYLNSFSSVSANEVIARSMAREVLRVYVISENEGAARNLSGQAMDLLARQWNLSPNEIATLRTQMDCSQIPCLTANGRIKLTISFIDDQTKREVSASAQEHLSPWL